MQLEDDCVDAIGSNRLLSQLTANVFEPAPDAEVDEHLGYDNTSANVGIDNSGTGYQAKTVLGWGSVRGTPTRRSTGRSPKNDSEPDRVDAGSLRGKDAVHAQAVPSRGSRAGTGSRTSR